VRLLAAACRRKSQIGPAGSPLSADPHPPSHRCSAAWGERAALAPAPSTTPSTQGLLRGPEATAEPGNHSPKGVLHGLKWDRDEARHLQEDEEGTSCNPKRKTEPLAHPVLPADVPGEQRARSRWVPTHQGDSSQGKVTPAKAAVKYEPALRLDLHEPKQPHTVLI